MAKRKDTNLFFGYSLPLLHPPASPPAVFKMRPLRDPCASLGGAGAVFSQPFETLSSFLNSLKECKTANSCFYLCFIFCFSALFSIPEIQILPRDALSGFIYLFIPWEGALRRSGRLSDSLSWQTLSHNNKPPCICWANGELL